MDRYLIVLSVDVADEGNVGLIKVVTEKELKNIKTIRTGFGNLEGDVFKFEKTDAVKITDSEFKTLKKFGLTNLEFGYCDLSEIEEEDEDE